MIDAWTRIWPASMRGPLFRKYVVATVAVVCLALAVNGLLDIWFSYREQRDLLTRLQQEQAASAATDISQYFHEIESQMAWIASLPWSPADLEQWRLDAVRLMREAPAITVLTQLDGNGREQFRMSRQSKDIIASEADRSGDLAFVGATTGHVYYGPIYYIAGSEPYMTIALAGARREEGIVVAEVNLKFIWDVVSQIKVGSHGVAYVVDSLSRLIAHPDISLVLRNTNLVELPQVKRARFESSDLNATAGVDAIDLQHRPVLSAHAAVPALNWSVFVDMPIAEAYTSIYRSVTRSAALLLAAFILAITVGIVLVRRVVVPIRVLHEGAARIGGGNLTQRISINTGDELEDLGNQFNKMASQLEESHATLERKVEQRTHELELANEAKSRFLAAASHDLRQPLHALGLFVEQLKQPLPTRERKRIIERVGTALGAMDELFKALLDISKLDAGATAKNLSDFPVARLLTRAETTFTEQALEKGLSLRIVQSSAWMRSDFILLERVLSNLISNAIRYTCRGCIVVGCRRLGEHLRIEVWDTGPGIPTDQHERIFGEFYRLDGSDRDGRSGLGLGLAIVDRLCRLLEHQIEVRSTIGKGSVFSVHVPVGQPQAEKRTAPFPAFTAQSGVVSGKLVVVIDDDPLVLEGMRSIFHSWGCQVIAADSDADALSGVIKADHMPDLIVSDYSLSEGRTGFDVVERLRAALSAQIPAFLISGDTNAAPLDEAKAKGFHLLHKPVEPMALRAMFHHATRQAP